MHDLYDAIERLVSIGHVWWRTVKAMIGLVEAVGQEQVDRASTSWQCTTCSEAVPRVSVDKHQQHDAELPSIGLELKQVDHQMDVVKKELASSAMMTMRRGQLELDLSKSASVQLGAMPRLKRIKVYGQEVCPENSSIELDCTVFKRVHPDHFSYLGHLGSGNFGRVDAMKHVPSGTKVAVKKMVVCNDTDLLDHMINEIRVLDKCCHEAIVNFFGYYLSPTQLWLCLELMDSCFERLLNICGRVPERVIGKVTVSVVNALDYIKSSLKLMHRDIKPSNILVSSSGTIKICDFGISCPLVNSETYQARGGCNAYLAPERINSCQAYDVRSDVWSLGVTLFELATGRHPYSCNVESEFDLLTHVQEDDPPSLPWIHFSPIFCHFILQCLRKQVARRPKYERLKKHWFYLFHKWRGEAHSREVVKHWFDSLHT